MKKLIIYCISLLFSGIIFAQDKHANTKKDTTNLDEIIVLGRRKLSNYRQEKTLSSIDEFLEKSNKITMIKREPSFLILKQFQ